MINGCKILVLIVIERKMCTFQLRSGNEWLANVLRSFKNDEVFMV